MTETLTMPWSEDAERSVLALALQAGSLTEISGLIGSSDFFGPIYRRIFEAMELLAKDERPIDPVTVADAMTSEESIGVLRHQQQSPLEYLSALMLDVVSLTNLAEHAAIIRRKAKRRRWILAARELAAAGLGSSTDDEFLQLAEKSMLELTNEQRDSRAPQKLKTVLREFTKELEARHKHRISGTGGALGIPTGLVAFDDLLSGLQNDDLIILGARPSMGKTAFALNAMGGAAKHGAACLVFSVEMSATSLVERLVASESDVDASRIRTAQLDPAHWLRMSKATAELAERGIWLDDDASITVAAMRGKARRWRLREAANKRALVVVDYIQLVQTERQRGRNREQEIAEISRGLKLMAKELHCPVVALAQLNRGVETREDKRPKMADLRESGGIEQDADVIAFLYRDEVYNEKTQDHGVAEVIIAKHRKGPTGVVKLGWLPHYQRFENLGGQP